MRDFAVLPFGHAGNSGSTPRVCISLHAAGDMWGSPDAGENRRRFFSSVGFDERRIRGLTQVHSKRVLEAETINGSEEGDALISNDTSLILSVRVADCFPIFLLDRATGGFAAAHSGWKGTGIIISVLDRMGRCYGTHPENVTAIIGPGIGSCCYDVPAQRAQLFRDEFGTTAVAERDGREYLDLRTTNLRLLREGGVREITSIVDCTCCSSFLGSFRREGPEFTRMLALIGYFG